MRLSDALIAKIKYTMFQKFDDDYGSQKRFAEYLGVEKSTVSRWLSGDTASIEPRTWEKIKDKLLDPPAPSPDPQKLFEISSLLQELAPGKQIVTGVINVVGIPSERIMSALDSTEMDEVTREELRKKIFREK